MNKVSNALKKFGLLILLTIPVYGALTALRNYILLTLIGGPKAFTAPLPEIMAILPHFWPLFPIILSIGAVVFGSLIYSFLIAFSSSFVMSIVSKAFEMEDYADLRREVKVALVFMPFEFIVASLTLIAIFLVHRVLFKKKVSVRW